MPGEMTPTAYLRNRLRKEMDKSSEERSSWGGGWLGRSGREQDWEGLLLYLESFIFSLKWEPSVLNASSPTPKKQPLVLKFLKS